MWSRRNRESTRGLEEHHDYLNTLKIPAIALSNSPEQSFSRIGGLPSLPMNIPWPEWKGSPLAFLCQLDLSEIPEECDRNGLPSSGALYFFYDQKQETWGFDPKDKGSWRVIYEAAPSTKGAARRSAPQGLRNECAYAEKPIVFTSVETYPDCQDERVSALGLNDKQGDEYSELCAALFQDCPAHQLFGYASPVQGNEMDLECELVSHGLYCGDASGFNDPRAKGHEPARQDWILLLQLDTDDDAGMMWGDGGMLYFWIRRQDLNEVRFEDCWMILQCA